MRLSGSTSSYGEKTHVFCPGEVHDLVKGPPAVILADGVSFFIAHMVVGRNENADGVRLCQSESKQCSLQVVLCPQAYQ